MLWTPKWKKEAKLTIKGSKKFINYKKDLIDEEKIKNIKARQEDVKEAIKTKDKKEVKKKCNLLEQECKNSLEKYKRQSGIAENTEVFFVAIVIALGIRAYYLQPFRIPTGSMQPTLNGINGHQLDKDKWPNIATRMTQMVTNGRSYYEIKADPDKPLTITAIGERTKWRFFTTTVIKYGDGSTDELYISKSALKGMVLKEEHKDALDKVYKDGKLHSEITIQPGETLLSGFTESGDLVLVDKASYHFRKPIRGETFVFDTRQIDLIHKVPTVTRDESGNNVLSFRDQIGGSHYIKRLVGVPGDEISIGDNGEIYVNGKIAKDKGLVYAMGLDYNRGNDGHKGYLYADGGTAYPNPLDSSEKTIICKGAEYMQNAEYAAFGDNTANSSDSRLWGTVKQYNLVGPALISLWPFTHEIDPHWGKIK